MRQHALKLRRTKILILQTKALRFAELIYNIILQNSVLRSLVHGVVRFVSPKKIRVESITLFLNKNDAVLNALLLLGLFEKAETTLFKKLLRPGMTFLDVGANIGYYSALAASLVGSGGTVIAMEPEPKNHALLLETTRANPGPKYHVYMTAASSTNRTSTFYVSRENCGDNRLMGDHQSEEVTTWSTISVPCERIDTLLHQEKLPFPDVIKIDVQGFEADVIKGCDSLFAQKEHLSMMIEFWPDGLRSAGSDPLEFLLCLKNHGFHIQYVDLEGNLQDLGNKSHMNQVVGIYTGKAFTNLFCTK